MKKEKCLLVIVTTALVLSACGGNANKTGRTINAEHPVAEDTMKSTETQKIEVQTEETCVVTDEMRAEADSLWNSFLDSVSVIETDSKYSPILEIVENTANAYAKYYATATGRGEEEYINMTPFEQFLWDSTYILPVLATTASGYDTYCGSVENWNNYSVGMPYRWLTTYGTQEMADSYRELMEWDYSFLMQTGSVYNFITKKTSAEENPNYVILDPAKRSAEQAEQAQQEAQQLQEELQDE